MGSLIETAGWLGMALIVLAYFLNSAKRLASTSAGYQLMNLFGATLTGINVYHHDAMPSLVLQIIWGAIAIASLTRK